MGIIELNLISSVPAAQKLNAGDHTKRTRTLNQTGSIKEQNFRTYERVKPPIILVPFFSSYTSECYFSATILTRKRKEKKVSPPMVLNTSRSFTAKARNVILPVINNSD